MALFDRQFEHHQQRRTVTTEGLRRVVLVSPIRARSRFTTRPRFTTGDRPEWTEGLIVSGEEFSGCV